MDHPADVLETPDARPATAVDTLARAAGDLMIDGETPSRRSTKAERREALRLQKADPETIRRAFESGAYPTTTG